MVQACQVQLCTGSTEASLCLFGNIHPCQHPRTGCLRLVIHLGDMTPLSHFVEELLAGKEPVHQEMQGPVQPVQEIDLFLGVMPVISHERSDDRVVLLFHMGIVILVIRTGTGEGDAMGMAETDEMAIHELSPIVRMQGDDLPRISAETGLKGSNHIDICFRPDSTSLSPPGAPVGDREGPPKVSHRLSSIMTHQVHGQDARNIQGRVHAGLNGDPATQRGAPGMGNSMDTVHVPLCGQKSPDRGRTHLEEEPSCLVIDMEMSMGDEVLRGGGHACCQTDRSQEGACAPDGDQCLLHERAVPGRSVLVDLFRGVSHEDTISQEVSLSCLVHDMGSISPAVSRGLTEVVQHCGLLCLPCFQIYLCLDHREFLPFLEPPLGLD